MKSLLQINELDLGAFVQFLGAVFEHSPWVAASVYAERPFEKLTDLHQAMCRAVEAASREEQLRLIRAHPDLVTRVTLTAESQAEQADAGLRELSPEEIDAFQQYNRQYQERFGFPFVICARLNKKEAILQAFPVRLRHSLEQEHRQAFEEIYKIAQFRLEKLVLS